MTHALEILLIEGNDHHKELITRSIREGLSSVTLRTVKTLTETVGQIEAKSPDVILLNLPNNMGDQTLKDVIGSCQNIPVIVLASNDDHETASQAFLSGAQDYLSKEELTSKGIARIIRHSIERKQFEYRLIQKTQELSEKNLELEKSIERRTRDLSRSESQYRSLVQAAPLAITRLDHYGIITFANPEFHALIGCKPDEVNQMNIRDFVLPSDYAKLPRLFPSLRSGRTDVNRQSLRILKRDGQTCWCNVTLCPVADNDQSIHQYICIIDDISERQQKERLEQLKTIAEEANRAKTDFLTGISHEIRTPLAAVTGFVDLALESKSQDERTNYLKIIRRNSKHLFSLVNDLLDLSKIEAGQLDVNIGEFSLVEEVENVISIVQNSAQEKGLSIIIDYEDVLPERIFTDGQKLRQILINLLNNAIKYTDQGVVTVGIKVIKNPDDVDSQLVISVKDTGPGIDAQFVDHLFMLFARGEYSKKANKEGLGVGLVLSRNLSRRLGGDVALVQTSSAGSTFQLILNVGDLSDVKFGHFSSFSGVDHTDKDSQGALNSLSGYRFLVAEDAADLRILVRYYLEKYGAKVDVCSDGLAAIEFAESSDYDCILMDIQMPVLRGDSATKKLRENGYKKRIVALTAHAFHEEREQSLECGFDGFLTKPVLERELIGTLRQLVGIPARFGHSEGLASEFADDPVIKQFTPIFLENLTESISSLHYEVVRSNWDQVLKVAHKIKGSSSCYGYPAISRIAASLEGEAKTGLRKDMALPFIEGLAKLTEKAKFAIEGHA